MMNIDGLFEPVEVVLEGYSHASVSQQHKIGEGGGAIKLALLHSYGSGDPVAYPTLVAPTSLKKFVTGTGKSQAKSQMLLSVYKKWGVELDDDNAADAYGLARVGVALQSGTDTAYERDVLAKLKRRTEWVPI
jgi:Holliday junction resolvasome RuvABC endonuclease subunit